MRRTRTRSSKLAESVKRGIVRRSTEKTDEDALKGHISSGCALLNLALSDKVEGGFGLGKMTNIIGDSSSGKSFLALSLLAECANSPRFDDYILVYDDVEQACEFDIRKLFGSRAAQKIVPPVSDPDEDEPAYSETIQDFHANVFRYLDRGDPFIYVLDSLDALDAEEDQKKAREILKARETGKDITGTYGMAKPKAMSWLLRQIVSKVKRTESALIIISQTRDNINPMSFTKKTRSGGRALKFYCTHEIWLAVASTIKKKDLPVGVNVRVKISKNKLTGKMRQVEFPLYYSYGVDDIGASVDWMIKTKTWKKKGGKYEAPGLGLSATKKGLIRAIEDDPNLKKRLDRELQETWDEIERSLDLGRKPKYS